MTTYTVKQTGGDYSSLSAALAAVSSNDTISIEGSWTVDDTTPCVVPSGTNDVTIVIGDSYAAHPGYWDTSQNHYRLVASSGGHAISLAATGTVIDGLAISQNGSGSSDEVIRVGNGGTNTIKNCILTCGRNAVDQDGIYSLYSQDHTINVENTIIYGMTRRGIGFDQTVTRTTGVTTINVNSCTIMGNGYTDENLGGGIGIYVSKSEAEMKEAVNVNIHNTVVMNSYGHADAFDIAQQAGFGNGRLDYTKIAINVSYSIDSDGSIGATGVISNTGNLNSRSWTTSATPGTGDWVCFENLTSGTYDFRIIFSSENDAQDMHTTSTAEGLTIPSTDIVGLTRPQNTSYDCGAYEIEAAVTHELSATDISSSPGITSPTVSEIHALTGSSVSASPSVETGAVSQTHILTGSSVSTSPSVETGAVSQTHILTATDIGTLPVVDSANITQSHILSGVGINTAEPTLDTAEITLVHALGAFYIQTGDLALGSPEVSLSHELSANGISTSPYIVIPAIEEIHSLSTSGINTGSPSIEFTDISQTHILNSVEIETSPLITSSSITQTHILSSIGLAVSPIVGNPLVAIEITLDPEEITVSPTVGNPSTGQTHILDTDGIGVSPICGQPYLSNVYEMSAEDISVSPSIETPDVGNIHYLVASDVDAQPTFIIPSLTHIHALSGVGVSTIPVVGIPVAHKVYVIGANSISVSPTTNDAQIGQYFALIADGLEVNPVVGTPNDGVIRTTIDVRYSATSVGFLPIAQMLVVEKTFYKPIVIFSTEDE